MPQRDPGLLVVEALREVHDRDDAEHDDRPAWSGRRRPRRMLTASHNVEKAAHRPERVRGGLSASGLEGLEQRLAPGLVGRE